MKKIVFLFLLAIFHSGAYAEKVYEFNSTCQQAYGEITELKLNNGIALIEKAKKENPDNLIPYVLESYVDFFTLFFNEDPAEYKIRKERFEQRISLLKKGPESSPFYLFCLGAVYLQKAAVAVKFGEMWTAGFNFKHGYALIKENKKAFPTFTPNDLIYGGLRAIIGTIPKGYQWLASLFGIKGSITEGMKTIKGFVYSKDPWAKLMNNESSFFYCYLLFYIENKKEEAIQFIQDRKLDVVNNHLFAYMAANLGINNKQTEYAKNVMLNKSKSPEYLQTGVWDFEMGFVKLYHAETAEAIQYFERFLANFKGKFYVKDVYQKLSWCYYLQGNTAAAQAARNNVLKKGSTDADADQQALKEAKSGKWPNPVLLKARMMNDGGYDKEALELLSGKTVESFGKEEEKLEFEYRLARINDDLGKGDEAIQYYLEAIRLGESRTEYYAARAAWQIGQIYEKRGEKAKAMVFYNRCLDMDDHDYKNSLDQKAKSGIARCKGE